MITLESVGAVAKRLIEAGVEGGVFVGGAVVGLYLTDPLAPVTRHTDDVDVVVPAATRAAYNRLEERLRAAGHTQVMEGPTCRWLVAGIPVDLMPPHESVLGFANRWYPALLQNPLSIELPTGTSIRVPSAPHMLATKIEAFLDRGKGDYLGSADIEDIVSIVDGREELLEEVSAADTEVKGYLVAQVRRLLSDQDFVYSVHGHMLPDEASQARVGIVLERLRRIAAAST